MRPSGKGADTLAYRRLQSPQRRFGPRIRVRSWNVRSRKGRRRWRTLSIHAGAKPPRKEANIAAAPSSALTACRHARNVSTVVRRRARRDEKGSRLHRAALARAGKTDEHWSARFGRVRNVRSKVVATTTVAKRQKGVRQADALKRRGPSLASTRDGRFRQRRPPRASPGHVPHATPHGKTSGTSAGTSCRVHQSEGR